MEGAVDFRSRQDAIRQGKILSFFSCEKEKKLGKKKRRKGERGRGRMEGAEGSGGERRWELFTLFQRYYKLSEGSCFY